MDMECDEKKRKKDRARKKALSYPTRDKMIKSPPLNKAMEGERKTLSETW